MYIKETALWCAALVFEACRPASEECRTISPCCMGGYCRVSWSDGGERRARSTTAFPHLTHDLCNSQTYEFKLKLLGRKDGSCVPTSDHCFVEGHLK